MQKANNIILNGFILLVSCITISLYIYSIIYNPVSVDASYYLSIVELMKTDDKLYVDIPTIYGPVFFYVFFAIKSTFGISINYTFDLFIILIFQLILVFFLFKVSKKFVSNIKYTYLIIVLYLLLSLNLSYFQVRLEVFAIMFGLASIYVLLYFHSNYNAFFVGLLVALSFFSKQYGLAYIVFSIVFLIQNKSYKKILFLMVGFASTFLFFYLTIDQMTNFIFGSGYSLDGEKNKSFQDFIIDNLNNLLEIGKKTLVFIPVFLIPLVFIFFSFKKNIKLFLLFFISICSFIPAFIVVPFLHYIQFIVPFILLLVFISLEQIKVPIIKYGALFLIIINIMFSIKRNYTFFNFPLVSQKLELNYTRTDQISISKVLSNAITDKKNVYIVDYRLIPYYYLSGFCPPNNDFSFAIGTDSKRNHKLLEKSNNLLIMNSYNDLIDVGCSKELNTSFFRNYYDSKSISKVPVKNKFGTNENILIIN